MTIKRVKVQYRHYFRGKTPAVLTPLSAAIASAIRKSIDGTEIDSDVELRTWQNPSGEQIILNGRYSPNNGDFYGELLRIDPDTNIPLLIRDAKTRSELEIKTLSKGNGEEFLRGMMYFLIRDDHVLAITQDISFTTLEQYLLWLVSERTQTAQQRTRIPLVPRFTTGDKSSIIPDVKRIKLQPRAESVDELDFEQSRSLSADSSERSTSIFNILKAALFDMPVIENLMRQHDAAIEVSLSVKLKRGGKTIKLDGEHASTILRNIPEQDLIVEGEGLRSNRGRVEHLTSQVSVESIGAVLNRKKAWEALSGEAASYKKSGIIT